MGGMLDPAGAALATAVAEVDVVALGISRDRLAHRLGEMGAFDSSHLFEIALACACPEQSAGALAEF